MKQRITTVQKEIVNNSVEKEQKMMIDNWYNEPTEEFSGCSFEFIDNLMFFYPFLM